MMTSFRASAMPGSPWEPCRPSQSRSANAARYPRCPGAPPLRTRYSTRRTAARCTGDESLPVPATTVPVHRCHAHQRRHLLAGQRAQLRQVRQQRSGSSPDRSPESTATTRPWPSTPDSPRSPGPTPRPPSRSPSPGNAARIASMLRRTRRPAVVSRFDSASCASRSRAGCVGPPAPCNSWVWAPASGRIGGAHPLGEFGQHLGVQRVGLGASGPARAAKSVPAWGSPGSPEDPSEQEPRRRQRVVPAGGLDHDECLGPTVRETTR